MKIITINKIDVEENEDADLDTRTQYSDEASCMDESSLLTSIFDRDCSTSSASSRRSIPEFNTDN